MQPSKSTCAIFLIGMFLTSMVGFVVLADYSTRPGQHPEVLKTLPAGFQSSANREREGTPTVIIFYHPKCPCTLATARSLERLRTTLSEETAIFAYAYLPNDQNENWIQSGTTEVFKRMAGTEIKIDKGAAVCRQFGVAVSGHILVYDIHGDLTFSGGITQSRGHEGDCLASMQFMKCAKGTEVEYSHWPVFGCLIRDSESETK